LIVIKFEQHVGLLHCIERKPQETSREQIAE